MDNLVKKDGNEVQLISQRAAEIKNRLVTLFSQVDRGFVEIAELFMEINSEGYYSEYGYNNFEEYVKNEFGFGLRKAQYYIAIYEAFSLKLNNAISANDLVEIGWSKCKEMAPLVTSGVINEDNARDWAAEAKTKSFREFAEIIAKSKKCLDEAEKVAGIDGESKTSEQKDESTVSMSFKLFPEQKKNVEAALEICRQQAESDKKGHLLDIICTAFITNYGTPGCLPKE